MEASASPSAPLANGPAVVFGTVRSDGGDAVVVTVHLHERPRPTHDASPAVWQEHRREVSARPFRVERDDGSTVRVEPDARVTLRDELEEVVVVDTSARRRHARLRHGERVWVSGVLSGVAPPPRDGAYRAAPQEPVMRRGIAGMLISTETPGANHRARARDHRVWFVLLLVLFGVLHGTLLLNVLIDTVRGRPAQAYIAQLFFASFFASVFVVSAVIELRDRRPWYARRVLA